MKLNLLLVVLVTGFALQMPAMSNERRKYVGVFKRSDKTVQGITYGNWGSRPYEYAWASAVVPVEGKRVIDLGTGIPSQFDWYKYVVNNLKPEFYVGVDCDSRLKKEMISQPNFEIKKMDMSQLEYNDHLFDIAYCINVFQAVSYDILMKSIQEAHRVLKDEGFLIVTLDEEWDKDQPTNYGNGWNTLEQSLIEKGLFNRKNRSFGLPEFLDLIKDYFVLFQDDATIDPVSNTIRSNKDQFVYYRRLDKDFTILNSGLPINSCVSYAVLKKKA